jgi:hypothetical protein
MSGAMEKREVVGIAVIEGGVPGAEGETADALVMKVAKQRVEEEKERMARVILHETRVNMPRKFVTEPLIHLSLNQLRSEQYATEDGRGKRQKQTLMPRTED